MQRAPTTFPRFTNEPRVHIDDSLTSDRPLAARSNPSRRPRRCSFNPFRFPLLRLFHRFTMYAFWSKVDYDSSPLGLLLSRSNCVTSMSSFVSWPVRSIWAHVSCVQRLNSDLHVHLGRVRWATGCVCVHTVSGADIDYRNARHAARDIVEVVQ